MGIRAREGDILETVDNIFFDVKGMVHPPRKVVAFIRFVPSSKGNRKLGEIKYEKVYPLSERYALLEKDFPQYLVYDEVFGEYLCEISTKALRKHYKPVDRLREIRQNMELDDMEKKTLQLATLLKETAGITWGKIGISGSILAKLHTKDSDIDPIIYGSENCRKVYCALKTLLKNEENHVKPYSLDDLKNLFAFRSRDTVTSFEDFVRAESRKVLQAKFMGSDYFIRFVKDWGEITEKYGMVRYSTEDYAKIKAKITDDSEAIFTPCTYKIKNVEVLEGGFISESVEEIVSFRGRFCEQAKRGETVIAQGKVERVQSKEGHIHLRLLLGNKTSDHMILS